MHIAIGCKILFLVVFCKWYNKIEMKNPKSYCPQNLILEIIGDKWSLLIIRDLMLNDKRYFREFLQSEEKIATNILSSRLKSLEEEAIIYRSKDPKHKQKIRYSLTKKGIDLFPILMENARWSLKYQAVNKEDERKAKEILRGGPKKVLAIMKELEKTHLNQ